MAKYFVLAAILLFAAVLYRREANAYFCGFDDLNEWHRIAFTANPGLADDFSTMPYAGYKYRPLSWTFNRLTYQLAGGPNPTAFRTRNLVFHLLNIVLLYAIAMLLFVSPWISATAALLFAIHPLVNQSVVGGVWTVTPSDFLMLLALWLFLLSLRTFRWRFALLFASMLAGWLGILAYDAVLFFFGLPFVYLAIQFVFKRKTASPAYVALLILLTVLAVGSYFGLRARHLPPGKPGSTRVAVIAKNTAIYAASFTLLIDPVLANEWFDTPLPSEALRSGVTPAWLLVTILPAFCIGLFILMRWRYLKERMGQLDTWPEIVFLAVAIAASFSAFLLFTDHASETYVYLPVAFFVVLMSAIICHLCAPERGLSKPYFVIMGVLVVLFSCAVWVRNGRVVACGSTVSRVLAGLPTGLAHGSWHLILADAPYEPAAQLYGMYGYKGVESLGFGDYGKGAVQAGLQAYFKNPQLTSELVSADAFRTVCRHPADAPRQCFWVHDDGRVTPGEGTSE